MKNKSQIIVVDDEADLLQLLVQRLERKDYVVEGFLSAVDALEKIKKYSYDIGIFDIKMPEMDGIELLKLAKQINPSMEIVILTGHGTIETAIEAMKSGAYDYLTKPYKLSELDILIQKALEKKQLLEENTRLKEVLNFGGFETELVGKSESFMKLIRMTEKVAKSNAPVLIEGESGTGKELIARALHKWSDRSNQPFIAINSGGLMENLLESELFGHVKGAFTGAHADKKGLLEMADAGTIFFDEIGEMPINLQVKLLRFFESSEFRRVGDHQLRYADVRVVAATNRNISKEIEKGSFREDLYFRLNVVNINMPPLRDRKEDIPLLVEHFLINKKSTKVMSKPAMDFLQSYHFPGNIRELSHLIERGLLLSNGEIEVEDMFPNVIPEVDQINNDRLTLQDVEKYHIEKTLKDYNGNKTKTAESLGISLRSLYRKIDEYKIM